MACKVANVIEGLTKRGMWQLSHLCIFVLQIDRLNSQTKCLANCMRHALVTLEGTIGRALPPPFAEYVLWNSFYGDLYLYKLLH